MSNFSFFATKTESLHPSKGDACDVENFLEYEDVVKKVLEKRPTRAITVFIDMKDVDKAAKKVCAIVLWMSDAYFLLSTERSIWRLGGRQWRRRTI